MGGDNSCDLVDHAGDAFHRKRFNEYVALREGARNEKNGEGK
jgi:hypothetical protein